MIEISRARIEFGTLERVVVGAGSGAVASFYGVVRDHDDRGQCTEYLEYEAYGPMAERVLNEIAARARSRWDVGGIAIVHRVGRLEVGEISVGIAVGSEHRGAALSACSFLIDEIKRRVPIWKREVGPGRAAWVEGEEGTGWV